MKRIVSLFLLAALLCSFLPVLASCNGEGGDEGSEVLYIYNWGEYIADGSEGCEDLIEKFEAETGIRVVYETFDSNETMFAMMQSGASVYDIVIPSDYMVERLIKEERLAKLDFDNIPNITNISDQFRSPDYDLTGEYSVPYTYGLVGLIYNKTMVDPADFEGEVSWRILWDEKYSGNLLTFNNARDAFGIAQYILSYENGHTAENDN